VAHKTVVQIVDDFDGKSLDSANAETVRVTLEGASYELDLSHANAQKLRDDFGKWLDRGRRASRRSGAGAGRRRAETSRHPSQTQSIRRWARSNGLEISDRGRIPASIVDAYNSAH
jgi:hypothetical protein